MRPDDRKRIEKALIPLRGNPAFHAYLMVIKESLENTSKDLCSDAVCGNERLTLAAIGEMRALNNMLDAIEVVEPTET